MKKSMKNYSTKNESKKNLVFVDWDGTLCYEKLWMSIRQPSSSLYEEGKKIDEILFSKNKKLVKKWMKGKVTSEYINKFLAERINISYSKLWDTFEHDSKKMAIDSEIAPVLLELKKTSYVCLITGNMDSFSRFTVEAQKLNSYFDEIVNSYDSKKLKTEYNGSEFKRIARKFKVPLENSYLLDDSKGVCGVFSSLGGTALHVSSKVDTISQLRKVLSIH